MNKKNDSINYINDKELEFINEMLKDTLKYQKQYKQNYIIFLKKHRRILNILKVSIFLDYSILHTILIKILVKIIWVLANNSRAHLEN